MLCRFFVVGALSLTISGCSSVWEKNPTREYPYWISPDFSSEHRNDLAQSLQTWKIALNGYISFEEESVAEFSSGTIKFFPSSVEKLTSLHEGTPDNRYLLGKCNFQGVGSRIDMAENVSQDIFQWVALHEIGHALGLRHSGKNTLMCEVNTCSSSRITADDLAQFRSIWEVP